MACGHEASTIDVKHRGAHVFGRLDTANVQTLKQTNIEWVTLVEWGDQDDYDSPIVTHEFGDSLRELQRDAGWLRQIKLLRDAGFKVFFKPHLWLSDPSAGKWRSDIFPANEKDWELWRGSYRDFILRYAKIAEQANVEMFCIGTELTRLTLEKPVFWKTLIQEVRSVYSGELTYAANWYDEFEEITFWDQLDFVGIQAYFPLVENEFPTVDQISRGWDQYLPAIESIHAKYDRKILFTELGYKSTAGSAIEPWRWLEDPTNQDKLLSIETQANCYEAFFRTVWEKEWFAGVHLWQFRSDYFAAKDASGLNFTPQGKPAESIITRGFE